MLKKRALTLVFAGTLLAACDLDNFPNENFRIVTNPLFQASQKIGLEERKDREELKEFIGVDPKRTEWCAAFVNAVLNESGIPGSESVSEYPLMARSFLTWGDKVNKEDIQAGDIVILPRGNVSWQGHVGFYVKTVEKNGTTYYAILGGNQSNKVSIELYRANKTIGIRRYNYRNLITDQEKNIQ